MGKGTKVKTLVGNLKYVFITGEGRNASLPGQEPKMKYSASLVCPKDGDIHKDIKAQIEAEWKAYKIVSGAKGLPKTNGIKDELVNCPTGDIDPATEKIKRIPTGNVVISFSTNTTWKDGNKQEVTVLDNKGGDRTATVLGAAWAIGEGSQGIIHGVAQGNDVGGTAKVTLYLSGIQLTHLVKYEGNSIDADVIEGKDVDFGDDMNVVAVDAGKVDI